MIILPSSHPLIESTLTKETQESKGTLLDMTFADFDRATYHLQSTEANYSLCITLTASCFNELFSSKFNAMDALKKIYPSPKFTIQQAASKVTLQWPRSNMTSEDIGKISLLKRHLLSIPFIHAFSFYDKWSADLQQFGKEKGPLIALSYRENESFYIQPFPDRIVVIFSTLFNDPTDAVLGRVFMQEFVDARKAASLQNSPQVIYSKEPPPELTGTEGVGASQYGYISFVLFSRHIQAGPKRETAVSMLTTFRSYFHYHMKCTKAYMHSRLRAKMGEFVKVLNRARPDHLDKPRTTRV